MERAWCNGRPEGRSRGPVMHPQVTGPVTQHRAALKRKSATLASCTIVAIQSARALYNRPLLTKTLVPRKNQGRDAVHPSAVRYPNIINQFPMVATAVATIGTKYCSFFIFPSTELLTCFLAISDASQKTVKKNEMSHFSSVIFDENYNNLSHNRATLFKANFQLLKKRVNNNDRCCLKETLQKFTEN